MIGWAMREKLNCDNRVMKVARLLVFGVFVIGRRSAHRRVLSACQRNSVLLGGLALVSGMATSSLQAALTWNHFAQGPTSFLGPSVPTDYLYRPIGESSLAVTFTTDGNAADLEGDSGTVSFNILEIVSVALNIRGTDAVLNTGPVQTSEPGSYLGSTSAFVWDRESKTIQSPGSLQSSPELGSFGGNTVSSFINFGRSGLDHGADGVSYGTDVVDYSFSPTTAYSFAPVPEPGEWGLIFGLGTLVVVGVRRRMGHGLCEVG